MALFDNFRRNRKPERRYYADSAFFSRSSSFRVKKNMCIPAVYRAVQLISDSVAVLPVSIFRNGKRVPNDRLAILLNNEPTPIMSRYQLMKKVVTDMLQEGNAFVRIIRNGDTGKVERLRWLEPSKVTVFYDKEKDTKVYMYQDEKAPIEDSEMLHFMNYSEDGIIGVSVISNALRTLQIASDSDQTASNYFKNGGAITGILTAKTLLNNDQKQQIKQAWNEVYASEQGGVAILGSDMTFQQVTSNAADMQLLQVRQYNVEEIARFFGVSPTLLGDLSKSSYATFEATSLDFLQNCLQPRITNIEQELNRKLLLPNQKINGYHIAFETEDLLRCTKTEMAQYYNTMIQNGIMSVNEVRRKLDFEPVPGGDEHYIQLNMNTLTKAAKDIQDGNDQGNAQE